MRVSNPQAQVMYNAAVKGADEENMDQKSVAGDPGVSRGKDATLNTMKKNWSLKLFKKKEVKF